MHGYNKHVFGPPKLHVAIAKCLSWPSELLQLNGYEPYIIKLTTDKIGISHQTTRALICTVILKIEVTAHITLWPKIATPLSPVTL